MITYNIECPSHLVGAAIGYLVSRNIIPPGDPATRVKHVGDTLVFCASEHKPESIQHLCLFLGQECAAWQNSLTNQHGFSGPSPWPNERWDPAKFLPLKPIPQAAPAPVGNLATTIAIPYGNDTPVRWCLWDTDSGLYVTEEMSPACTYSSQELALRSRSLARAMRWKHWTSTRPTSA